MLIDLIFECLKLVTIPDLQVQGSFKYKTLGWGFHCHNSPPPKPPLIQSYREGSVYPNHSKTFFGLPRRLGTTRKRYTPVYLPR